MVTLGPTRRPGRTAYGPARAATVNIDQLMPPTETVTVVLFALSMLETHKKTSEIMPGVFGVVCNVVEDVPRAIGKPLLEPEGRAIDGVVITEGL